MLQYQSQKQNWPQPRSRLRKLLVQMVSQETGIHGMLEDQLLRFSNFFLNALKITPYPPSMYGAHIVLIPKLGKDQKHCASYRPISLLNSDLQILTTLITIHIPLSVLVCLLGLVGSLDHCQATRALIGLLLFYVRKALLLKWKQPELPSLNMWKSLVNSAVPLYKATYLARCCPVKFNKIWHIWLESDTTNATQ